MNYLIGGAANSASVRKYGRDAGTAETSSSSEVGNHRPEDGSKWSNTGRGFKEELALTGLEKLRESAGVATAATDSEGSYQCLTGFFKHVKRILLSTIGEI